MDATKLAALLGRPLTANETANVNLYLDIAWQALEELICTPIAPVTETRTFNVREGYSTAFLDIFRAISQVKVDGTVIDPSKYSKRQWDKRTATWFNSIVLSDKFTEVDTEIEVTGDWGFVTTPTYSVPSDLQLLIAGLFDLITKKNNYNPSVKSKQVEDFRITFADDLDLDSEFSKQYVSTIAKYSLCNIGYMRHGEVC